MRTQFDPARSIQIAILSGVAVSLLALSIWSATEPGIGLWLAFDRAQVANGQWWRPLTGFIAHWTPLHALANALGIAGFGWLIASREGARIVAALMLLSLAVQLPCLFALGHTAGADNAAEYRGDSGFLYTMAVFCWLRGGQTRGWRILRALIAFTAFTAVAAFARLAIAGAGMFTSSLLPIGIASAWQIHVAGIAAGLLAYGWLRLIARTDQNDNGQFDAQINAQSSR